MYTERIDEVLEIMPDGTIQRKLTTVILEDGVEVARKAPHRSMFSPGENTPQDATRLNAVKSIIWTPQIIADHQERIRVQIEALTALTAGRER